MVCGYPDGPTIFGSSADVLSRASHCLLSVGPAPPRVKMQMAPPPTTQTKRLYYVYSLLGRPYSTQQDYRRRHIYSTVVVPGESRLYLQQGLEKIFLTQDCTVQKVIQISETRYYTKYSVYEQYLVFPATFCVISRKIYFLWDSVGGGISYLGLGGGRSYLSTQQDSKEDVDAER